MYKILQHLITLLLFLDLHIVTEDLKSMLELAHESLSDSQDQLFTFLPHSRTPGICIAIFSEPIEFLQMIIE